MKKAILEGLTEIEQNKALKHVKTGFQNMGSLPSLDPIISREVEKPQALLSGYTAYSEYHVV